MTRNTLPVALLLGWTLISCSTEVDLEGAWEEIPIVYGVLERSDTAHYIRVEKAFQTSGQDAGQVALIPDSIYYKELEVRLERVSTGQQFLLTRVNGVVEGYERTEGAFPGVPNFLYKIRAKDIGLKEEESIRLWMHHPGSANRLLAETRVIGEVTMRETSPSNPVNMGYDRQVAIGWNAGSTASLFELRLVMHYRERLSSAASYEPRKLVWVLVQNLEKTDNSGRLTYSFYGKSFFQYLEESIREVPGIERIFDGIDIEIDAGGQEFADNWHLSNVKVGITSTQWQSNYTNIAGGRGIFSSRAHRIRPGLQLSSVSMDSLRYGIYTRNLNFK